MKRIKKNITLYFKYISIVLRSSMQYKASFLLMIIGRFFVAFGSFVGISFLFSGFKEIKGYTYGEILLCFSVIQISFAISECVSNGFCGFAGIVKGGGFDRILLRPLSPILQVLGSRFELGRIGPMVSALIMLIIGLMNTDISWTVMRVVALIFMIVGGSFLFTGLFMIGATICFFSIEESGSINILTYGAKEHGKYPIDIYGNGIKNICTYVIPYTLFQYYPLQYLLGRSTNLRYIFYPFGIVLFVAVCYAFWRFGLKHYKSCGS